MPLFQIGYRRYEGPRTSHLMRWLPITRTGMTIAWRSKVLRRLVYASFLPFLYFGWVFFLIGRVTDPGMSSGQGQMEMIVGELLGQELLGQLQENPELIRSTVWGIVFAMFGTKFQLIMAGLVGAIVGPSLVANDVRSRSFLIYFSRPITRTDYVLGKSGILIALLAAVTLLPSCLLYTLSILFSPSIDTLIQTTPIALTMVLASLVTIVPATLVLLTISSLTSQPRFATAAWIVLCTFGPLAHTVLQETRGLRDAGWTFMVSLPHSIHTLQLGLYDIKGRAGSFELQGDLSPVIESLTSNYSPVLAAAWLAAISVSCVLVLLRRVDAPTRI